jgi:zinc protease
VKAPAELPVVLMGYKAPIIRDVEKDVDPYALEMLGAILDGHDAARFSKIWCASSAWRCRPAPTTTRPRAARACSTCRAAPSEGKTVAELEAGLRAEIARVVSRRA